MSLRLITSPQSTNVVRLRPARKLHMVVDEQLSEPNQFGDAVVVALLFRQPTASVPARAAARESEVDRLWAPEHQLIHGYLSVDEPDEVRVDVWTRDIADFSTKAGYRLGSIFIDRNVSASSSAREGFIELMAALRLPGTYAVVVPSLAHLSTDSFMQQVLMQMVQLTGSQVLVSASNDNTDGKLSLASRSES